MAFQDHAFQFGAFQIFRPGGGALDRRKKDEPRVRRLPPPPRPSEIFPPMQQRPVFQAPAVPRYGMPRADAEFIGGSILRAMKQRDEQDAMEAITAFAAQAGAAVKKQEDEKSEADAAIALMLSFNS